jgi:hypothetical protein
MQQACRMGNCYKCGWGLRIREIDCKTVKIDVRSLGWSAKSFCWLEE